MREMDEHFGDVYGRISDREIEISHELAQFVLQYKALLISCSDVCGELDRFVYIRSTEFYCTELLSSLLALAQGAQRYNLRRPQMTRDNVIRIAKGR
jgi:DNA mismatch repair protein MSH5